MDWWQIFLIILLSIFIGLGVGYGLGYLIITKILKRPFIVFPAKEQIISTAAPQTQETVPASGLFTESTGTRETTGLQAEAPVNMAVRELEKTDEITVQQREGAIEAEELPTMAAPNVLDELTEERARKQAEQETRELLKREAEEARKARITEERTRKKAEQQARELAKIEAEKAKKARELEERERKIAEQQARELAKIEAEKAKQARELEERERKIAEQQAAGIEPEIVPVAGGVREGEKQAAAVAGEDQAGISVPNLFSEIEHNRKVANEPWTGTPLPFETTVWSSNPAELHALPANMRENLAQVYSDIQLANSIVWLATELGRRSSNLDDNYTKLCTNIAARLEVISPLLKQSK